MRDVLQEVAELLGLAKSGAAALARLGVDALQKQTKKQLLDLAKKLELKGTSGLTKDVLAERVLEAVRSQAQKDQKVKGEPAREAPVTPRNGTKPTAPAPARREEHAPAQVAVKAVPPAAKAALPAAPSARAAAFPAAGEPAGPKVESMKPLDAEQLEVEEAEAGQDPSGAAKLDLGPGGQEEAPVASIPWAYGIDRVTAAAVDPNKLFVYWEVTDPAIERARTGLGQGGAGAWLNVRVYDTTGLIFDGTNAHGYFDHKVERSDRQWFFTINKPASTAYAEIGMRSTEGYFVRIARSSRVDFPRSEPAPWIEPEWLTVLPGSGQVQHAGTGTPWRPGTTVPVAASQVDAPPPPPSTGTQVPLWFLREPQEGHQVTIRELLQGGWERVEWQEVVGEGWFELEGHVEWQGPHSVSTWEAGPFSYPVSIEAPTRAEWQGRSFAFKVGDVTHVVYGPWQVEIRNLGAHAERAVVARWEVFRSWVASAGREVQVASQPGKMVLRTGASELMAGASERIWLSASELRLGGASEVWRIGASELRFRGASERTFAGASQWLMRGASEKRLGGASEVRMRGASERVGAGASERMLGGSSERMGASDRMGASEQHPGASEQRFHVEPDEAPAEGNPGTYPQLVE